MDYNYYKERIHGRSTWTGGYRYEECFCDIIGKMSKAVDEESVDKLTDVAVELFDLAGMVGINFDFIPANRFRHSFEMHSFKGNAMAFYRGLIDKSFYPQKRIQFGIHYIDMWLDSMGYDLQVLIDEKI